MGRIIRVDQICCLIRQILHGSSFTAAEFFDLPSGHHLVTCVCDVARVRTEEMERVFAMERPACLLQKEGDVSKAFSPLNSGLTRPETMWWMLSTAVSIGSISA